MFSLDVEYFAKFYFPHVITEETQEILRLMRDHINCFHNDIVATYPYEMTQCL